MYPIYDSGDKPDMPTSRSGCFWYVVGFCVFSVLLVGCLDWVF